MANWRDALQDAMYVDRKIKSPFARRARVPQRLPPGATARRMQWGKIERGALGRKCTRSEVYNHLHGAYVASEALRYSVGLVERIALLTGTGRRDGGWVCRKFQVVKDLADDLTLC